MRLVSHSLSSGQVLRRWPSKQVNNTKQITNISCEPFFYYYYFWVFFFIFRGHTNCAQNAQFKINGQIQLYLYLNVAHSRSAYVICAFTHYVHLVAAVAQASSWPRRRKISIQMLSELMRASEIDNNSGRLFKKKFALHLLGAFRRDQSAARWSSHFG